MTAPAILEAPRVTLRPYQQACVDAVVAWHAEHTGHCLAVVPTGGGKSLILGALAAQAREQGARALVLAHREELLAQNMRATLKFLPGLDVGIVSGTTKRASNVTLASIQTFGRRPYTWGAFDHVIVDEAHLIPHGSDGLFHRTFKALETMNPAMRVTGLTATPYRLGRGMLHEGKGALFTAIAYSCDLLQLMGDGYLCPLVSRAGAAQINVAGVSMRGGEFIGHELAARADDAALTRAIVAESLELATGRRKLLAFATSVEHAQHMADAFTAAGCPAGAVWGDMPKGTRADTLEAFRSGRLRALVNCELLTTGYDEPAIDCLIVARPTGSPGLHVQMLGRGLRIHPDKTDTLVLDYAGNLLRHGPLDAVRPPRPPRERKPGELPPPAPAKLCPTLTCRLVLATAVRVCPGCGHEFPEPTPDLSPRASDAPALSSQVPRVPVVHDPTWVDVTSVEYAEHVPRDPTRTHTLRVDYLNGYRVVASEWVCIAHDGFARRKAVAWWNKRCDLPCPLTIADALEHAHHLAQPVAIALLPDGEFTRVSDYRWTNAPASSLPRACWACGHWDDGARTCTYYQQTPPDFVQPVGCESFTDADILPF